MNEKEIMELVDKAIAKDNQAMETLYTTFYRDVLYVCKKLSLNDADANDIAQDSFIDAFSKLDTLSDKRKFRQWVCRIANNKALNLLKHNNVLKFENIDDDNSFTEIPDKEKSAESQVIENEVADILKNIIEKLPLEQKITVFMYYYEDMSVKEIASAYGISENTVRSRLNYAKKFITFEVNKLEDKGIKLRCTGLLPFLYLLFAQEKEAFAAGVADSAIPSSAGVIAKAMKNASQANTVSSVATSSATTAKVAGTAVKTFSIGKIIGISSAIVAVIAAAVIGFTMFGNNDKSDKKDDDKKSSYKDYLSNDKVEDNSSDDKDTNEDSTTDNNSDSNDNTENKEETKYETGDEYWDYYSINSVNLPEITYETIEYLQVETGPITANVADTIFNFTLDEVKEKLGNTSFYSKDKYTFSTEVAEECELTDFNNVGVQKQIKISDTLYAYPNEKVNEITSNPNYIPSDFVIGYNARIIMNRDISNYNNYNEIYVNLQSITINRDSQKEIFAFLEGLFGKELATYMTYGTDTDGKNNDTFDYLSDRELGDYIKIGDTTYFVSREISISDKETSIGNINFKVSVTHKNEKEKCYYTNNYNSIFNSEDFLANYIRGNFGVTNINDISNFGSEYMKLGLDEEYVRTMSDKYTYKIITYPDETVREIFLLDTQKGCSNVANLMAPELNILIDTSRKNDQLTYVIIEFDGDVGYASVPDDTEPDYTRIYAPLIGKLSAILGNSVDLSPIDSAAFSEKKGLTFETQYLNTPCTGTIAYNYGINMAEMMTGKFEIEIALKK